MAATALLLLAFARPLYHLADFSLHSELFSYIPMVPAISLFLVWFRRPTLPPSSPPDRIAAALLVTAGFALLAGYGSSHFLPPDWNRQDALFITSLSCVVLFAGVCGWFLGRRLFRAIAFPLGLLVLIAPLPVLLSQSLESFFQHTSAAVAYGFFELSGTPVFPRGDLGFQLPGMNLEVAPQCSGLHSSLALIITSLPAGYLLLRSPWRRAALTAAAIPLGILRNGFRIFTIGELCVHLGPQMINSSIHRTGGWMFFLLSLVPFFLLLFFLARSERPSPAPHLPPLRA